MKNYIFFIAVLLFSACSGSASKYPEYAGDSLAPPKQDSTVLPKTETKSAAVLYAGGIISGQIKPAENNECFAWLDSLQSQDKATRQLAYRVTEIIITRGQGFLAESAGSHLKSYLQLYPKDFLANYRNGSSSMQKKLIENCAYEFYASGTDYAVDIDNYFKEVTKACTNCTAEEDLLLADIRTKIESMVKNANE